MEEYYNEYTYKINSDLTIDLLNKCYKLGGILDPEILINEQSNSISFDFGWHIFELNLTSETFLTIAVKENSIALNAFIDDDELPFSITEKDDVFIGVFNVNVEDLAIIPLERNENFLFLNRGKMCLPLGNNNLEYYASPVSETKNEYYRIRVLMNEHTEKGALLIQKGPEGFHDNILSPMLNQINIHNSTQSEIFMAQNPPGFSMRNAVENDYQRNNNNIDMRNMPNMANTIAKNNINDVLDFFDKKHELNESSNVKYRNWIDLLLKKVKYLGKSLFLVFVSISLVNFFDII